ncbi:MAG: hypothetical protein AAFW68_14200 [Pseudomonadota bacterium]
MKLLAIAALGAGGLTVAACETTDDYNNRYASTFVSQWANEEVVCDEDMVTGSRLRTRVTCMTETEREMLRKSVNQNRRDTQITGPGSGFPRSTPE